MRPARLPVMMATAAVLLWAVSAASAPALGGRIPSPAGHPAATGPASAPRLFLPLVFKSFLIYVDEFADPASGWPVEESDRVAFAYRQGEYVVSFRPSAGWADGEVVWAAAAAPLEVAGAYRAETLARTPHLHTAYGIVFGLRAWDDFYALILYPNETDGHYSLLKQAGASQVVLVDWTQSSHILPVGAYNRLAISRQGQTLAAFVNGHSLDGLPAHDYPTGAQGVGLYAERWQPSLGEALFDSFRLEGEVVAGVSALGGTAAPCGVGVRPAERGPLPPAPR